MLTAHQLSKHYGGRRVFDDLSFALESGTVAAVLGGNGSGKSTLLRIAATLLRASAGTLSWGGSGISRAICGFAAADAAVYPELTVLENLRFFSVGRGVELSPEALAECLGKHGLKGRGDDLAGSLSSGLVMRLQLAVAVLHAPCLLLLDEPSANLDDAGRELVAQLLQEQRARGVALVATNDPRDEALCDAAIRLGRPA